MQQDKQNCNGNTIKNILKKKDKYKIQGANEKLAFCGLADTAQYLRHNRSKEDVSAHVMVHELRCKRISQQLIAGFYIVLYNQMADQSIDSMTKSLRAVSSLDFRYSGQIRSGTQSVSPSKICARC